MTQVQPMSRSLLSLIFCATLLSGGGVLSAQDAQPHAVAPARAPVAIDPADIIRTAQYAESLVRSVSADVEFQDVIAPGEMGPEQTDWIRRVQREKLLYDDQSRMRHESETSRFGPDGQLVSDGHKLVRTYDRQKAMTLDISPTLRFVGIDNDSKVLAIRRPSNFNGVRGTPLSQFLRRAADAGAPMRIEPRRTPAGADALVVSLLQKSRDQQHEFTLWLDPTKLYYPLRVEKRHEGRLIEVIESSPREVAPDVWMASEGRRQNFATRDGKVETVFDSKMLVHSIAVNLPKIPPSMFEVELLPETLVADARFGQTIEYVIGVGSHADRRVREIVDAALAGQFQQEATPAVAPAPLTDSSPPAAVTPAVHASAPPVATRLENGGWRLLWAAAAVVAVGAASFIWLRVRAARD